jgi:hypothetical protein
MPASSSRKPRKGHIQHVDARRCAWRAAVLFQHCQEGKKQGCTFFYSTQEPGADSPTPTRSVGRLAASCACMALHDSRRSVFPAAWTHRTAAGAATWVAPTCCSERAPRKRDRRIGCMGDLTRKTASKAPRYSVGRFVSDRKGQAWKVAGRSRRRVVSLLTFHLRFPNAGVGRRHCHNRT